MRAALQGPCFALLPALARRTLGLAFPVAGAVATGDVSCVGASGTRPHCTARPGLPKEIADLIWVAALLLVDCDDLVGRGVCWPRRRDMKEV